jgi:cell division protein FtsZ
VVVGIGSAGVRVVSMLSKRALLVDRFAYISCDGGELHDSNPSEAILVESPVDQKLTPSMVRGLALKSYPSIVRAVSGAKVVFVVAGLGGATGSGLAPLVASVAQECGATTIGVAMMPFEFEKKMKFYAGVSLRRLRAASRGVIVIDNDNLMRSAPEDSTLTGLYDSANNEAVKALGSMLSKASKTSVPVGLNKLLGTVLQDGYSLLGVSSSAAPDKAEEALARAVVSLGKLAEAEEANRAVVILNGDSSLSGQEVGLAVKRLGSMINNKSVDVEYGVDYSGSAQLQVSLLASGFRSTKYDDYDPLNQALGDKVLDDEMDTCLPDGLDALQPCD